MNVRMYRRLRALAVGGITLGWLQGLQMVDFASLLTQWLSQFFAALVTVLLGGDSQFLA